MEILPILRLIWRRRFLVAAGVAGAVAVLVALGGTTPATTTGAVAWTRLTLDTPRSQVVAAAPPGGATLAWRASLLSHLLASETLKQELARRLGVPSDQVAVADPALALPTKPTDTAVGASKAAAAIVAPYVVTILIPNNSLPIISLEAAGPDRSSAARLAGAAVAVLQSQASPAGRFGSLIMTGLGVGGLTRQGFVVEQIAPVRVQLVSSSSLPIKPIGASLFIFVLWCAGVLLLPRLKRAIRGTGGALPAG
jgi:hypothetical protein